ncbi:MAG: DUF1295 domain-containing protein [Pseudolabrys sp.]
MTLAEFVTGILAVSLALAVAMSVAWLVWFATRNSGWIDTGWTFGLGLTGIAAALWPFDGHAAPRQVLVAALIAAWALRLGLHIAFRTAGIVDDPRYAKLVGQWGGNANWQMFLLAQKQALISIPLAIAMLLAAGNPAPDLRLQDYLAAAVFVFGIAGEALADAQLRRFRADPANAGKVCDRGLWAWSRHPNYFFEWVCWLAFPLFAIDLTGGHPFGWLALIGPACMYWVLVHVTGIPYLEAHMLERRGEAFRAYQARTSAFFPVPPRSPEAHTGARP